MDLLFLKRYGNIRMEKDVIDDEVRTIDGMLKREASKCRASIVTRLTEEKLRDIQVNTENGVRFRLRRVTETSRRGLTKDMLQEALRRCSSFGTDHSISLRDRLFNEIKVLSTVPRAQVKVDAVNNRPPPSSCVLHSDHGLEALVHSLQQTETEMREWKTDSPLTAKQKELENMLQSMHAHVCAILTEFNDSKVKIEDKEGNSKTVVLRHREKISKPPAAVPLKVLHRLIDDVLSHPDLSEVAICDRLFDNIQSWRDSNAKTTQQIHLQHASVGRPRKKT